MAPASFGTSSNYFNNILAKKRFNMGLTKSKQDELETYLSAESDPSADDPILWWQQHTKTYPCLSRMAIDFLTIPGMYSFYFCYFVANSP